MLANRTSSLFCAFIISYNAALYDTDRDATKQGQDMHDYQLETERLLLRAPRLEDAPAITELAGDARIAEMTLNIAHPYPADAAENWIRSQQSPNADSLNYAFLIVQKDTQTVMGGIGIKPHSRFKRAEIGYWIGVPYWGHGYTTEAARRIIQFGFDTLDIVRIEATFMLENSASLRIMQKVGMQQEGVLRQYVQKQGKSIDLGICSILYDDWQNVAT